MWQWSEIPGTALASVEPSPRPIGATGPRSKIDAWCGAALRRRGSLYLIGAAGGHADYAGNEVNALDLSVAAPRWAELMPPSPASVVLDDVQFYLDGRPSATHTYYASHCIESQGRLVVVASQGVFSGFPPAPAGYAYKGTHRSYSFDLTRQAWDGPEHIAHFPGQGGSPTACFCVKHPHTDDIFYSRNNGDGFYQWLAAENRWVRRSNVSRSPWFCGAAIDPLRNRILTVGSYSVVAPSVIDLNGQTLAVQFGGLGAAALTLNGYPGVVYDEALDRFLVLFNSNGRIRVLMVHPETWAVSTVPGLTAEPNARPNGLHNAAQYAPELGGIVLANSYSGNVLFLRTSS